MHWKIHCSSRIYLSMSSSIAENGFSCLPGDSTATGAGFTGIELSFRSSCRFLSSSANCFKDSRTIRAFSGSDSVPLIAGRASSLIAFFFGALGTFRSCEMIVVVAVGALRIVLGTSPRERSRFFGDRGPACVKETIFLGAAAAFSVRGVFGALVSASASSWPKFNFCLILFDALGPLRAANWEDPWTLGQFKGQ